MKDSFDGLLIVMIIVVMAITLIVLAGTPDIADAIRYYIKQKADAIMCEKGQ